jgi:hypothetical protein
MAAIVPGGKSRPSREHKNPSMPTSHAGGQARSFGRLLAADFTCSLDRREFAKSFVELSCFAGQESDAAEIVLAGGVQALMTDLGQL